MFASTLPRALQVFVSAFLTAAALSLVLLTGMDVVGLDGSPLRHALTHAAIAVVLAFAGAPALFKSVNRELSDSRSDYVAISCSLLAAVLLASFATGVKLPLPHGFATVLLTALGVSVTAVLLCSLAAALFWLLPCLAVDGYRELTSRSSGVSA